MQISFTITKTRLALAIVATTLAATSVAFAGTFTDVPEGQYYTEAVEWAFDNGITTGTSATTFAPDDNVTRGQNVTFAKRYHDNVVAPSLDALTSDLEDAESGIGDNTADIAGNAADIAALPEFHTAHVNGGDGVLTAGSTGISSTRTSEGDWYVDFPVDIDGCHWQVSATTNSFLVINDTAMMFLNLAYTSPAVALPTRILVEAYDETGADVDTDFHLLVIC